MKLKLLNSDTAPVIIFGADGYVGTAFKEALSARGVDYFAPDAALLNLFLNENVAYVLKEMKPSFVINCAGFVGRPNVDACETQTTDTYAGNVTIPFNLAQICENLEIPWGHVSSGCIYNGYEKEYTEEDPPNFCFDSLPCSYYSGTKAEGEKVLKDVNCYVWRLRIPFDEFDDPRNYLTKLQNYKTILSLKNSCSHKREFADKCLDLWEASAPYGTYNVVNGSPMTAEEIVKKIREHLNMEHEIKFMENIEEFYKEVGVKTPRSNCVLSNEKLLSTGIKMRDTEEAIDEALRNWKVKQ